MIHFSVVVIETQVTPLCYVKSFLFCRRTQIFPAKYYPQIFPPAESISSPFHLLFVFSIIYCPRVVSGGVFEEALVEMLCYEGALVAECFSSVLYRLWFYHILWFAVLLFSIYHEMLLAFSFLLHSKVAIKIRCVHNRAKTIRWHGISLSLISLPWDAWCGIIFRKASTPWPIRHFNIAVRYPSWVLCSILLLLLSQKSRRSVLNLLTCE